MGARPGDLRLLHLANIIGHHNRVRLSLDGWTLSDGDLRVPPRTGAFLALGLDTPLGRVEWANAELVEIGEDRLVFGPPLGERTTVVLRDASDVRVDGGTHQRDGDVQTLTTPAGVQLTLSRA